MKITSSFFEKNKKILRKLLTSVYKLYILFIYKKKEVNIMNIIISNSSNIPLYEQVKEQIKNKIVSNELKSGELLPSIRNLAKDLRISVITTKNAYEELEKEGYVETVPGKGTYVANKNVEIIRDEQLQKIENLIDTAVSIAKISSITKKEIEDMLNILYEED